MGTETYQNNLCIVLTYRGLRARTIYVQNQKWY